MTETSTWPKTTPQGYTYEHPSTYAELIDITADLSQGEIEGWDESEMPPEPTWRMLGLAQREIYRQSVRIAELEALQPDPEELGELITGHFTFREMDKDGDRLVCECGIVFWTPRAWAEHLVTPIRQYVNSVVQPFYDEQQRTINELQQEKAIAWRTKLRAESQLAEITEVANELVESLQYVERHTNRLYDVATQRTADRMERILKSHA